MVDCGMIPESESHCTSVVAGKCPNKLIAVEFAYDIKCWIGKKLRPIHLLRVKKTLSQSSSEDFHAVSKPFRIKSTHGQKLLQIQWSIFYRERIRQH